MESLSEPANTDWPFPFTPRDWEQTPPAVQAYLGFFAQPPKKV